jgi:uncharacterized protein with NRDE domain
MCTLVVLHRCDPDIPLVVAANRDEWFVRQVGDFQVRSIGKRTVLAPKDLQAGGTWLGLNDKGLFAAITNRPGEKNDDRRSRGLLVLDALACNDIREAAQILEALPDGAYNGFNLFVGNVESAILATYDEKVSLKTCEAGPHVIGNSDPNGIATPKVSRILSEVKKVTARPSSEWVKGLSEICRSHEGEPPYGATCVHAGEYGTKSSTLVVFDRDGPSLVHHSWGAPCERDYRNFDSLLKDLKFLKKEAREINTSS